MHIFPAFFTRNPRTLPVVASSNTRGDEPMRSNDDFPIARSDGRHIPMDQLDLDLDRHGKLVTFELVVLQCLMIWWLKNLVDTRKTCAFLYSFSQIRLSFQVELKTIHGFKPSPKQLVISWLHQSYFYQLVQLCSCRGHILGISESKSLSLGCFPIVRNQPKTSTND